MTTDHSSSTHQSEEDIREKKLAQLQEKKVNPFAHSYQRSHTCQAVIESYVSLEPGEVKTDRLSIAGRIIAKRGHGKAFFGNIQDDSGTIQFYTKQSILSESVFSEFLQLDAGDIIGIEGTPFKTRRGELTVEIQSYTLLTKSLLPLPEKYHGLQNKELRYRHRYIDLIANAETKQIFKTRSKVVSLIRSFLEKDGFMEVETPVLHNIYGGASARPFKTYHNELKQHLYLRIALELHLKRLIVGGFEKVFELGRVFRNEGISYKHNPEYTLLELYQAYSDYNDMMTLTETLLSDLVYHIHGSYTIQYKDTTLNFKPPFKRIKLTEILSSTCDIDCNDTNALQKKAEELNITVPPHASRGHLIMELYDAIIEPTLIQPTFIIDHPWETSPLAKKHRDNPQLVERFELIIHKMEIANAFSELNDPIDQANRFEDQRLAKKKGQDDAHLFDDDFIKALKHGMPPTGGLGLGIDRIVMLLTNASSIRDVIFFPHMKDND